MIQIENEIYTELRGLLLDNYEGIYVTSEYTPTPDNFPCAFIEESDNYTVSLNGSNEDEVANVTFEINVFSNLPTGQRKSQCKKIMNTIDGHMTSRGFVRLMCQRTPNLDPTVYRMTARYQASVFRDGIYRS